MMIKMLMKIIIDNIQYAVICQVIFKAFYILLLAPFLQLRKLRLTNLPKVTTTLSSSLQPPSPQLTLNRHYMTVF